MKIKNNIFKTVFLIYSLFLSHEGNSSDSNDQTKLTTKYKPTIELNIKKGNKRDVGRLGILLPIYESNKSLIFTNIFGLLDNEEAKEVNFGLAYRHLFVSHILGSYGFFDARKSKYDNNYQQMTFGFEYLKKNFETRLNFYVPLGQTRKKILKERRTTRSNFATNIINTIITEESLAGFDIEIGGNLPRMPQLEGYITYYHFQGKMVKPVNGIRFRSNLNLNKYISLEGEIGKDRLKNISWFGGIKFKYDIGKKENTLSKLEKKMTQMIVRDIDVITDTSVTSHEKAYLRKLPENIQHAYETLDLPLGASFEKIRKRYKKLGVKHHPDKRGDIEKFKKINNAYEILSGFFGQRVRKNMPQKTEAIHPFNKKKFAKKRSKRKTKQKLSNRNDNKLVIGDSKATLDAASGAIIVKGFTGGNDKIKQIIIYSQNKIGIQLRSQKHSSKKTNTQLNPKTIKIIDTNHIRGLPKSLITSKKLLKFAKTHSWHITSSNEEDYFVNISGRLDGGITTVNLLDLYDNIYMDVFTTDIYDQTEILSDKAVRLFLRQSIIDDLLIKYLLHKKKQQISIYVRLIDEEIIKYKSQFKEHTKFYNILHKRLLDDISNMGPRMLVAETTGIINSPSPLVLGTLSSVLGVAGGIILVKGVDDYMTAHRTSTLADAKRDLRQAIDIKERFENYVNHEEPLFTIEHDYVRKKRFMPNALCDKIERALLSARNSAKRDEKMRFVNKALSLGIRVKELEFDNHLITENMNEHFKDYSLRTRQALNAMMREIILASTDNLSSGHYYYLQGPANSGKARAARKVVEILKLPFYERSYISSKNLETTLYGKPFASHGKDFVGILGEALLRKNKDGYSYSNAALLLYDFDSNHRIEELQHFLKALTKLTANTENYYFGPISANKLNIFVTASNTINMPTNHNIRLIQFPSLPNKEHVE